MVGHGVDREDVPVSSPVEAEYDDVMASSTDGLPFRKSLMTARRRFLKRAEQTADFSQMSGIKRIKTPRGAPLFYQASSWPTCRVLAGL